MTMRTLIHIRHGETPWNAARRLQGWQDIPLNDKGLGQARGNGLKLRAELERLGLDPHALQWIASPLQRACRTMQLVREGCGLPVSGFVEDGRLKEISYGAFEGLTHEEIAARSPDLYRQMIDDKWGFRPPDGESYFDLRARVEAVLGEIHADAIIVAHGGILRMLRSIHEGSTDRALVDFFVPQDQFYVWRGGQARWV